MKNIFTLFLFVTCAFIQAQLPVPDHIVIIMFQNKGYSQIVGSSNAPYINSLLADTNTAVFTQSYALTHPSQPNYLMLYSGSAQGVNSDNIPTNTPFTTCNLGASLISKGFTFGGYSESMPSVGYLGTNTSLYYRKHNPWSDWQGTQNNNVPASVNQPFSGFPTNFNLLPNISFVVPNIINCMHDGTIAQGDNWFQANLDEYVQWAKRNNSLLICTFDEDNNYENNHILTFFCGPMVQPGNYNTKITHYDLLRTLEDIYKLNACGNSASAKAINFVWKKSTSAVNETSGFIKSFSIFPVPCNDRLMINLNSAIEINDISISLIDGLGRQILYKKAALIEGNNSFDMQVDGMPAGIYQVSISGKDIRSAQKVAIE